MSRRRSASLTLAVAMCLAAGCRRTEQVGPRSEARDGATTVAPSQLPSRPAASSDAAHAAHADADAGAALADDEEAYRTANPTTARSIGHTSVVFKVELSNGKKAAFKPASRRGPARYKGEIAARRLALALGLPNVPPVLFRTFPSSTLASAKGADEMIVKDGVVKGALIPWIVGLKFLSVERAPLSTQWKQWLTAGTAIPDDRRELARQISTLVAFDFVSGNWDRWSGGNVGLDEATGTLLYIDNDGAFFEVPPQDALSKNKRLVEGVDKLSRGFVTKLRALAGDALAHALGEETPGVPLLSPKALAGVAQRREQLLELIDAKLERAGEDATLVFP